MKFLDFLKCEHLAEQVNPLERFTTNVDISQKNTKCAISIDDSTTLCAEFMHTCMSSHQTKSIHKNEQKNHLCKFQWFWYFFWLNFPYTNVWWLREAAQVGQSFIPPHVLCQQVIQCSRIAILAAIEHRFIAKQLMPTHRSEAMHMGTRHQRLLIWSNYMYASQNVKPCWQILYLIILTSSPIVMWSGTRNLDLSSKGRLVSRSYLSIITCVLNRQGYMKLQWKDYSRVLCRCLSWLVHDTYRRFVDVCHD